MGRIFFPNFEEEEFWFKEGNPWEGLLIRPYYKDTGFPVPFTLSLDNLGFAIRVLLPLEKRRRESSGYKPHLIAPDEIPPEYREKILKAKESEIAFVKKRKAVREGVGTFPLLRERVDIYVFGTLDAVEEHRDDVPELWKLLTSVEMGKEIRKKKKVRPDELSERPLLDL